MQCYSWDILCERNPYGMLHSEEKPAPLPFFTPQYIQLKERGGGHQAHRAGPYVAYNWMCTILY